ncbi:MAG TPA: hypothetical protein VFQ80_00575 [Thermomicrobiales bacterium]|nr:hypothetical protein [Thermomicrobiales bacterium]
MATLDAAKAASQAASDQIVGAARAGQSVQLANGVYDLHVSLRFLTQQHGALYAAGPCGFRLSGGSDGSLPASATRAVRDLIRRGYLVPTTASGRDDWDTFRRWQSRCRFVRRATREGDDDSRRRSCGAASDVAGTG